MTSETYGGAKPGLPYRWGGAVLTVLAAVYFLDYVVANWANLPDLAWNQAVGAGLMSAIGLYLAALLILPVSWHLLLRAAGEAQPLRAVFAISLLSQFAKYIPGNVAQHIGRVVLARGYGIDVARAIFTMTVETGWVIFAGATLCVLALAFAAPALLPAAATLPPVWQFAALGLVAAAAPLMAVRILARWRPGPLRRLLAGQEFAMPPARVLFGCFAIYLVNYLLMGAILTLLASRLFGQAEADFWLLTGIFAVAWIAGFLTPGAPGGLGVREAILVAALGPLYGEGMALALALTLRAVTTAGDGLGFLMGLAARRLGTRPEIGR